MLPVSMSLQGKEQLMRRLRALTAAVQARVLERVARRVIKPAVTAVRSKVRSGVKRRTGLLTRAIGAVVRNYRHSGTVGAGVGARRSIQGTDPQGRPIKPSKYFHLVELPVKGQTKPYKARRGPNKKMVTIKRGRGQTPGMNIIAAMRSEYRRSWSGQIVKELAKEIDVEIVKASQ